MTSHNGLCPLHSVIAKEVEDHEARLRSIEHCNPEQIPAQGKRIANLERAVDRLTIRIGTWAAVGMIVGGLMIQAFTRYVLGW